MLRTEVRIGLPAGVEEDQQGFDVVLRGDGEEGVETPFEALGILLPELVLQEDAHGVHADALGHAELFVVQTRVEGGCLKHLELVDGVGRDVVGANEPGLLLIPGVGLCLGPAMLRSIGCGCGRGELCRQERKGKKEAEFHEVLVVRERGPLIWESSSTIHQSVEPVT